MTRSVSGRAAAEEQWERGKTGGCGVESTGCDRGEVSRRLKAGLKSTRKVFYSISLKSLSVCVCFQNLSVSSATCKDIFAKPVHSLLIMAT